MIISGWVIFNSTLLFSCVFNNLSSTCKLCGQSYCWWCSPELSVPTHIQTLKKDKSLIRLGMFRLHHTFLAESWLWMWKYFHTQDTRDLYTMWVTGLWEGLSSTQVDETFYFYVENGNYEIISMISLFPRIFRWITALHVTKSNSL